MSKVVRRWIEENEEEGPSAAFCGFDKEMGKQSVFPGYDDLDHEKKILLFTLIVGYLAEEVFLSNLDQVQQKVSEKGIWIGGWV